MPDLQTFVMGKGKTPSKVPDALPLVAPFSKESSNNIIKYLKDNFNPSVNKHEDDKGVLFQDKQPDEKLIAGYSYDEVMEKLTALHEELADENISKEKETELTNKIKALESAFDVAENPDNYSPEKTTDIMLNAYYIMNNQDIPQSIIETEEKSTKTYKDLLDIHNKNGANASLFAPYC